MREILFRGKRIDNGEWEYGDLIVYTTDDNMYISNIYSGTPLHAPEALPEDIRCEFPINPETVGQFTGLTDKNSKKIFEGDIVKAKDRFAPFTISFKPLDVDYREIFHVGIALGINLTFTRCTIFSEEVMSCDERYKKIYFSFGDLDDLEIIGNIHDNYELWRENESR